MIKISNLNKYYNKGKKNEIHVLKNITYEFPSTGLVTFLGESGSGKTTLLNLLGGLLYSDETIYYDNVIFNSKNINELDKYRNKNIGFIFQNYLLLNNETVYDNLRLALEVCDIFDKEEQEKRIVETLKALKIYRYRKKIAGKLSGGEQQRVSIARAIVKGAKVLLCDEPTGNLDKKNSIKVMDILKSISKNALVILVTHNKDLARFYSDRIINMRDGEIISENSRENYTLDTTYTDTIYLGDLKEKRIDNDKIKINYYTDNSADINLRVILQNGRLFIQSNVETNIFDNENLDVREGTKKDLSNENLDYNFDFSDFNDKYDKDYSFLNLFFKSFKKSKNKIKEKIFKSISYVLGLILALFSLLGIASIYSTQEDAFYDEGYYILNTDEHALTNDINYFVNQGFIDNVVTRNSEIITFDIDGFDDKRYSLPEYFGLARYSNEELLVGLKPDHNGIVLGEKIAYMISKEYDITYEEIVGENICYRDKKLKINGITKNNCLIYFSKDIINKINKSKIYNLIDVNDKSKFEVVEENSSIPLNNSVFVEKSSNYKIGYNISNNLIVRGYIKEIPELDDVIVTNQNNFQYFNKLNKYAYYDDSINICEGRNIEKYNEIIIPKGYGSIGDVFNSNEVVGIYDNDINETNCAIIGSDFIVDQYLGGKMSLFYTAQFKIKNMDSLKSYIENSQFNDFSLSTSKDYVNRIRFTENELGFIIVFVTTLIATLIYIYFMKRSEIIVDHYNITVLRSMGATKKYIYKRYLASNIAESLKTITFGLLSGFLIYYVIVQKMNNVLLELINILVLTLLVVFSYFLITLLPLHGILKKEPAYLTAKYDI